MGGCKCSYRNCPNATHLDRKMHFFHYPINDTQRCKKWLENAHKTAAFADLTADRLRNKVICQEHFEENCFVNMYKNRLLKTAVPTLDCQSSKKLNVKKERDVNLVPIDPDKTKFKLDISKSPGFTLNGGEVVPSKAAEVDDPLYIPSTLPPPLAPTNKLPKFIVLKKSDLKPSDIAKLPKLAKSAGVKTFPGAALIAKKVDTPPLAFITKTSPNDSSITLQEKPSMENVTMAELHIAPTQVPKLVPGNYMSRGSSTLKKPPPLEQKPPERKPAPVPVVVQSPPSPPLPPPPLPQPQPQQKLQTMSIVERRLIKHIRSNTDQLRSLTALLKMRKPKTRKLKHSKALLLSQLKSMIPPTLYDVVRVNVFGSNGAQTSKVFNEFYEKNTDACNYLKDVFKWKLP